MNSMNLIKGNRQAVPALASGVVFGLDISKDSITYRACRPDAASNAVTVSQDMKGFRRIAASLQEYKEHGHEVWVAYEPTGVYSCCVLDYLVENNWKVVQINPKHTSKFNDIMDNAPGKMDCRDPFGMAGLVWQGCYRIPLHLSDVYAELRVLSAEWSTLSCESTRLRNQLHSLVRLWCPELDKVFKNVLCMSARAIIRKYPSVEAIVKAGPKRIRRVLSKASRGRTACRAEALLEVLIETSALKSGHESRYTSILHYLARLELVEEQQKSVRKQMSLLLLKLPESGPILSTKGIGVVTTAILLGECGNIGGCSAKQLEKLVGLNLCEFSSGKYKGKRKISKCGRAGVRYAICVAATRMTSKNGIYHDVAEGMRARGMKFGQIRIAVARKLLRLLHALACKHSDFENQQFVARRKTADDPLAHQDSSQAA